MEIKIALAGNPNSGKTTLFNALTGSNQYVGNWPGVTVEKKEGKLKRHDDVVIMDLPGIYSLSPYTLEEVISRGYLVEERPDAILNIVDGTNLERNLYLTTQLTELGIPTVIAINMVDVIRKYGDKIDLDGLSRAFGCPVCEISALKGDGINEAADAAVKAARGGKTTPQHSFSGVVEHALAHIEEAALHDFPTEQQRWYAIKIFERDSKVLEKLKIDEKTLAHIESDIVAAEKELDDDAESIITNERYDYIARKLQGVYKKSNLGRLSTSEKIDKVVTNRIAALPIFALIMFLVYFISVTTVGTWVTDFTNDGLFGDGWHLLGIGNGKYEEAVVEYAEETVWQNGAIAELVGAAADAEVPGAEEILSAIDERDFGAFEESWGAYGGAVVNYCGDTVGAELDATVTEYLDGAPDPADYGVWVLGVPVLFEMGLDAIGCADWLKSLVIDGIVAGVGAVLGFVPQILMLFLLLAFLEACGYMSRIAFIMDRIFRKFGLSGKSFIPMLVGTGCSVPGIMASRTIENEQDRRMTVITTSFMPCGAKLPVIALISGAVFSGAWWVAPVSYFVGIFAIVVSGLLLKKTKKFSGEPSPFVMELPAYHMPTFGSIMRSMWERGWSFIKKAGTIILLSTVLIWATSSLGFVDGAFTFDTEMELSNSILGYVGTAFMWFFAPLGFGTIEATVATIMGLVAKEEIVAVLGVLDFIDMTRLAAFSFLMFNLLCAPCFAAIGAIKREMNNTKWTLFAIGYQTVFAYITAFSIYQIGSLFTGAFNWWEPITAGISVLLIAAVAAFIAKPDWVRSLNPLKKLNVK